MSAPFYLGPPPAATLQRRGDIYEFVPIPWLNPSVHILRNWQQGAAEVYQASRVRDAFRVGSRDNKGFSFTTPFTCRQRPLCASASPMLTSGGYSRCTEISWSLANGAPGFHLPLCRPC